MMLVRTTVRPSSIHGLGCFAEEDIRKGQVIWEFDPRFDIVLSPQEVAGLPAAMQDYLEIYAYTETRDGREVIVLNADNGKYMNHSDNPNVDGAGDKNIAARDIRAGEELTCDYHSFDLSSGEKL